MAKVRKINVIKNIENIKVRKNSNFLWKGDVEKVLDLLPNEELFDLVITSPPYNIGKEYEKRMEFEDYISWQKTVIKKVSSKLKTNGSICWIVGNYTTNSHIIPIDFELYPVFKELNLTLRNRIVWSYGHGHHQTKRFSGRYEVILWYTKGDNYTFNLDEVRIPSKYPAKKYYRGPKAGQISSNPLGKNPEDVWAIPQVKSSHIEKTDHPCQFPVGLVERLILALSNKKDIVFDPFVGSGSTGVGSVIHDRKFWGVDIKSRYINIAEKRINDALNGKAKYRPHTKPIYDHKLSKLSLLPNEKIILGN